MIIVTGATGNVGTAVARELASRGVPFRALAHDPSKAGMLTPYGADVVVGDLRDPQSLAGALNGVDRAFLLTPPTEAQRECERNFVAAARQAGVARVVKQSMVGADPIARCRLMRSHGESERHLADSGLATTFVRANAFMENTFAFIPTIAGQGAIFSSIPDQQVSHVAVEDIARVAVEALTGEGHEGRTYNVTGPEALSFVDIAAQLSEVTGRPVPHITISDDDARRGLAMAGVNAWRAEGLIELLDVYRRGGAATVEPDVEAVTGRPPVAYRDWAVLRAAAFAGAVPAGA
jgi:uncharacterized protein YbjT (DUF2867 family)